MTQPMLDTPKKQFLLIGALEAASSILGFIGAAKLPGVPLVLTVLGCIGSCMTIVPGRICLRKNVCHAGCVVPIMGFEQTPCFGCWWNRGIAYAIQLQCACDLYHMVFTLKMNIMCCKLQSELHAV